MLNYLLTSFFIHAAILLALFYTAPASNTSSKHAEKITVNIVETPKARPQPPILPSPRKSLIHGPGPGQSGKDQKVDLTDYANRLKAVVDPIWLSKLEPLNLPDTLFLSTEVLLFPDKNGNLVNVKILKSSGSAAFDKLTIDALREVKQIPIPSDLLVKEGIIWTFSTGRQ